MKNNFRLLFLLLLACCMLLSSCRNERFSELELFAETDQPCILLSTANAKTGENSVEIAICIQNNPGIVGMTLELEYDENALKLEKIERGDALRELTFTKPKLLANGCRVLWDSETVSPADVSNGVVAVLHFSVADAALPGDYAVTVRNYGDIVDNDLLPIRMIIENGKITVS